MNMTGVTPTSVAHSTDGGPSNASAGGWRTQAVRRHTFIAAIAGTSLGAGLSGATLVMAAAGPTGDAWSFRGNGALVVPIGFGAAVLTGGWLAVFLCARGVRAWMPLTAAGTVAAALPSMLSILLLVIFGRAAQAVSDLMTLPALAGPVLALVFGVTAELRPARSRRLPRAAGLLAALVFAVALGAGFFAFDALVASR